MKKYLPNDALWIMLETGKAGIADCVAFEHIANTIKVMFSSKLCSIVFYFTILILIKIHTMLGVLVIFSWPITELK